MAAHARTECAACGGRLRPVLDLGSSPLADYFPKAPRQLPAYPLRMMSCASCGLCQLADVVDDEELFGKGYGFVTGGSPALVRYYETWAEQILGEFYEQAQRLTVDIGCNDGTLLEQFGKAGCDVLGVDPSEAAWLCLKRGIAVEMRPFGLEAAQEMREKYGPAGLVTGINVAAHTADPLGFLKGVAHLLDPEGVAIFEFQDLRHLVSGCQFDHVYHEHRFFFSPHSFAQLAAKAGLCAFRMLPTPGQGGSVRVYLRICGCGHHGIEPSPLERPSQLDCLQERAEWARTRLVGLLEAVAGEGKIAGYAASAKSATLLNFCRINHELLSYVEDVTPSKIGRYTPGTNIPICAPGDCQEPGTYLIMAWNYLGHAMRQKAGFLRDGGKFIVPIPVPVII